MKWREGWREGGREGGRDSSSDWIGNKVRSIELGLRESELG